MPTYSLIGGDLNEEEAAAAMAAVSCLLDEEAVGAIAVPAVVAERWVAAARLIAQGIVPTRLPAAPNWGSIERLRRATRGGSGIVGQ
jgi:hypothetical protein